MKITRIEPILIRTPLILDGAVPHASGAPKAALYAQLCFAVSMAGVSAPIPATIMELFPTRTRYSGAALGYNLLLDQFTLTEESGDNTGDRAARVDMGDSSAHPDIRAEADQRLVAVVLPVECAAQVEAALTGAHADIHAVVGRAGRSGSTADG